MAEAATVLSSPPAGATPAAAATPPPASGGGSPSVSPPAPASSAAGNPPAANQPWYGELSPDLKTFAETKQFKDPASALESYRNLERMVGVPADQLVRKPKDANDADGMKAYRAAIGVPESADKYELPVPAGQTDNAFAGWAAQTFLDAGVPREAAHIVATKWNEFANAEMARMDEAAKVEFSNGMVKWKDEAGAAFDERLELAKRAFRTFGPEAGIKDVSDAAFAGMERAAGGGIALLKLLAAVGARTSEATFHGGQPPQFTMTAEQARAKMDELKADKAWASAYLGGDKNKQAEFQRLMEISLQTAK